MARFSARCSCGAVRCAIDHDIGMVVSCHCTVCREMSGSAFSSMVPTPAASIAIESGAESLSRYALSEVVTKHFCAHCGTPLFNTNTRMPGMHMFFLGTIDGHAALAPAMNVYCRSKLGWVDRVAELPSHAALPGEG
jgi:hypothetical protein